MRTSPSFRFALVAFTLTAALAAQDAPQTRAERSSSSTSGERLPAGAWSPLRFVDLRELTELERGKPQDRIVRRMRGDAHGSWVVPSESTSSPTSSGTRYITNQWGDTRMGIGFPEPVDLAGAWILGQTGHEVWTDSLVAIGYLEGIEVSRTAAFVEVGSRPGWFAIELDGIDRVVFECAASVGGGGWYGLDDLAFTSTRDGRAEVLDFEDLEHRFRLTGSGYAGLRWEAGTGAFEQNARVIEQPLTDGSEDENQYRTDEESLPSSGGGGTAPTLLQDFKGTQLFDNGAAFIPPDTCGVVAPSHFVEVVNANLSVYDRVTQSRVVNVALSSLFGAGVGDPRVAWDHFDDRVVILATDFNDRIYLAVSLTDDPTGTYFTASFQTDGGSDAGRWPDYPTLGFDENGYYTGIGQFGGSPVTMTLFAIDKEPLVDPSPSLGTVTAFRGFSFEGANQPAVTYGTPGRQYFVSRASSTSLRLREILPPLTSPTLNELGTVSIPAHNFPPDVESQGSAVPLDSVDHRPMNSVFRNGSLWTAHAVGVNGRAAARWYEIDPIAGVTLQLGTVDDPELGFVMPTLAVNTSGDVVMGFSGSSPGQYAGTYYTGRIAGDPAGEMARPVQYKVGEGPYQRLDGFGRNRWGDYSLTSVDPIDDLTFWTVQEYAQTSNNWGTWMAELTYPGGITDCNGNGIDDADDISNGTSDDCNFNGIPDECEADCDGDGVPDDCETDCNSNGIPDDCETFDDCNSNGVPDECEADCDGDGVPDDCETDCNSNGIPDDCETFNDCNSNGIPDECEADCDGDGVPDDCETDCNSNGIPDDCETFDDCNSNGIPDECEADCDGDGVPDDCETDCNSNGIPDDCETFDDCNSNGVPDECEADCDGDGVPDDCETDCNSNGIPDDCETFNDCNSNGIPDECEADCDGDGVPDDCETDCNSNGIPDDCETFDDCNSNGVPDECEPDCDGDGVPDDCETDCNSNGIPDDCETFNDCNSNGIPDECEADCDGDGVPDDCETDCNSNGIPDDCETFDDCNSNGVPDECEPDCDGDGVPDDCETDCNSNGIPDDCETFDDCNSNGIPDECEADCDGDGVPDDCETDCNSNGIPDDCETFNDCNSNGIPDECEADCDGDGVPDDCETDCNSNGIPDDCETFDDCNSNGVPDECEPDCDGDGVPDDCETDCNSNGIPDDCETFDDCNSNGIPDECEADCDGDGVPDDCETDCNSNGIPDDCETFNDCNSNGVPDDCEPDSDGDGTIDDCELGVNYCGPAVANSSGLSGVMDATGSKVVSDNDLTLVGEQLAINQFGYFLVSETQAFIANPGGSQGNLCLGGTIGRYRKDVASTGATGTLALLIDLDKLPGPLNVGVNPGETWNFQAWFRDKNPDQTSNFTDGLSILFE